MSFNGEMTRSFYGGLPVIIWDSETLFLGGMDRSFYGGLPILIGPEGAEDYIDSGDVPISVTLTDSVAGEDATIRDSISASLTLSDAVDGNAPKDSIADTATLTDQPDGYTLKDNTQEQANFTDAFTGQGLTDGTIQGLSLSEAWDRYIEVERAGRTHYALFSDVFEGYALAEGLNETIDFRPRSFGDPANAIRRKQLLWSLQNEHIQVKFSHSQADKTTHAEDVAIRAGKIRRQDSIRWAHQGDHLSLKFQHNEADETVLLKMLALQVYHVSNLYTVKWQDTGFLCHQGNHISLKIQHNIQGAPILLETMNLRVIQNNNPTSNEDPTSEHRTAQEAISQHRIFL